jgi:hypothetical protein
VGEKVPKADEGALEVIQTRAGIRMRGHDGSAMTEDPAVCKSPLIRLCHLLPPQKARGEKALDWRSAFENDEADLRSI